MPRNSEQALNHVKLNIGGSANIQQLFRPLRRRTTLKTCYYGNEQRTFNYLMMENMMTIMLKKSIRYLLSATALSLIIGFSGHSAHATEVAATLSNPQQIADCSFAPEENWWATPYASVPGSIANNPTTQTPEFCEFYQFAQDWFFYLISPSGNGALANWEDPSQFPLLETGKNNSCDDRHAARALTVRTAKTNDANAEPVLPERIDQAGANAIYDQNGNVVFYEVRFSRNLCDYEAIQKNLNFPAKTVELKMAWRVLETSEPQTIRDTFYATRAEIDGQDYILGLVGWHIVVAAENHPEMVWITLDRDDNAIDCSDIPNADATPYSFTSASCTKDLASCTNLNDSIKSTSVKLPDGQIANDICRVYPYGTVEGNNVTTNNGLNIALIKKLNTAMPAAYSQAGIPANLKVWEHYKFKGALWISNIEEPSGSPSDNGNQRGSLKLANAVMETTFQGQPGPNGDTVNCFACHNFAGSTNSNTGYNASLSHSFDDIINGQCNDVQSSSVVNNQQQADSTCPSTCASTATPAWNGQWTNQNAQTGAQLPMTVCGCCPATIIQ